MLNDKRDSDLRIPKPRSFLTLQHDIFISIQDLLSIETGLRIYYTLSFHKQCLWLRFFFFLAQRSSPTKSLWGRPFRMFILCPSGQLHNDFDCCLFLCVLSLCVSVSTLISTSKILSSMTADIAFISHACLPVSTILSRIQ